MLIPSSVDPQKPAFFSRDFYHGLTWAQPNAKEVLCLPRRLAQVQVVVQVRRKEPKEQALPIHTTLSENLHDHPWARRGRSRREVGALPM